MQEEILAIEKALQIEEKVTKGMRTYYLGQLFEQPVVLVFSRWGKVASATTVTQLINYFDVREVLFTGVGGGIAEDVRIGDVVVGESLYQYDMDASPLVAPMEVPLLRKKAFDTDPVNRDTLLRASNMFLKSRNDFITASELQEFNILDPKALPGDIASGDQFVSTAAQSERIRNLLPQVKCVEMEGAAIAQVCYEYEVPFSIIRTISDRADDNSHIDFPSFAKSIASKYALGILYHYFKLKSN